MTGKFDKSREFNGSDDYINFGNPAALNITSAITVGGWYKTDSTKTGSQFMIAKDDATNRSYGFQFHQGDGKVYFQLVGTTGDQLAATATFNDNNWHHWVGTFDGNYTKIYKDGIEIASEVSTGTINTSSADVFVAARSSATDFLEGSLDDVVIYNRALDATEIAELAQSRSLKTHGDPLAQAGGITNTDGLVGYWKADGNWNDASGNGNNGTANGGVTFEDGLFGKAGSFDGGDDYVEVGALTELENQKEITYSAWIKKTDNGSSWEGIISKGTNNLGSVRLQAGPSGDLSFFVAFGEDEYAFTENNVMKLNQWQHVMMVYNGN